MSWHIKIVNEITFSWYHIARMNLLKYALPGGRDRWFKYLQKKR